jgi:hypothetical protein
VHDAQAHHAQVLLHPGVAGGPQVPGRADAVVAQELGVLPADAPHVVYGCRHQRVEHFEVAVEHKHPVALLGYLVGQLGQRFGGAHANRYRDARPLLHRGPQVPAEAFQFAGRKDRKVEERLVDAVHLHVRRQFGQRVHYPGREVAVEFVVGGKHPDVVLVHQCFELEVGGSHRDAQRLGFLRAGNHAAVVVAQHDHGLAVEPRVEDPFAGAVKVVAVNQGEHRRVETGIDK